MPALLLASKHAADRISAAAVTRAVARGRTEAGWVALLLRTARKRVCVADCSPLEPLPRQPQRLLSPSRVSPGLRTSRRCFLDAIAKAVAQRVRKAYGPERLQALCCARVATEDVASASVGQKLRRGLARPLLNPNAALCCAAGIRAAIDWPWHCAAVSFNGARGQGCTRLHLCTGIQGFKSVSPGPRSQNGRSGVRIGRGRRGAGAGGLCPEAV